jgi:hypothetical protein
MATALDWNRVSATFFIFGLVDKGKSSRCTCLGSPGCQHTTRRGNKHFERVETKGDSIFKKGYGKSALIIENMTFFSKYLVHM